MFFTELGIVMEVKLVHSWKTWLYNSLMVLGSVTEARLTQPAKAYPPYKCHCIGYRDGGQGMATSESASTYFLQGFGKLDGLQIEAAFKAFISYFLYGVGNRDGGQSFATQETSKIQNRHGVWNVDGGQV